MNAFRRYQWMKAAAGILYPRLLCANCGQESEDILCPTCRQQWETLRRCPDWATFIAPTEAPDYRCAACRRERPPFAAAVAALPYEGELRQRLLAFKYRSATGWRRALGELLAATARRCYGERRFDAVLPIPLAPARLRERGYNQSALLSRIVAGELQLPLRPEYLRRIRDTRPLAELDAKARVKEIDGAFRGDPAAAGQHLLLIDDIYTTGATASAATRALLAAGAASVCVLTVAAGRETRPTPAVP